MLRTNFTLRQPSASIADWLVTPSTKSGYGRHSRTRTSHRSATCQGCPTRYLSSYRFPACRPVRLPSSFVERGIDTEDPERHGRRVPAHGIGLQEGWIVFARAPSHAANDAKAMSGSRFTLSSLSVDP
jgi:hypothetical protein